MYLHKNKRYHIQDCSNEVLTIEKKKFLWSLNRQKRQGIVWDSILTANVSGLKKKTPGEEWVRQPKNYYFWWHGQKQLWMGMLWKNTYFLFYVQNIPHSHMKSRTRMAKPVWSPMTLNQGEGHRHASQQRSHCLLSIGLGDTTRLWSWRALDLITWSPICQRYDLNCDLSSRSRSTCHMPL